MKILNLGCGTKTSSDPQVVNIDWSMYLCMKKNPLLRSLAPFLIGGERLKKFNSLSENIMVHDLAKGIPFGPDSVDVVYHAHMLEHLDRDDARKFLTEIKRVLKPGGILRIVVPDLEKICKAYISHISLSEASSDEAKKHDAFIAAIIEQSVRRESMGTVHQKPLRRFIENLFLGDARKRGETHQWMYDRISLRTILNDLGFKEIHQQEYNASLIPRWNDHGLDLDEHGNQNKPESLYIEAIK